MRYQLFLELERWTDAVREWDAILACWSQVPALGKLSQVPADMERRGDMLQRANDLIQGEAAYADALAAYAIAWGSSHPCTLFCQSKLDAICMQCREVQDV